MDAKLKPVVLALLLSLAGCVSTQPAMKPEKQGQAVADYMNLAKGLCSGRVYRKSRQTS